MGKPEKAKIFYFSATRVQWEVLQTGILAFAQPKPEVTGVPVYIEKWRHGPILSSEDFLLKNRDLQGEFVQGFLHFNIELVVANDPHLAMLYPHCTRLLPYWEGDGEFKCASSSDVPHWEQLDLMEGITANTGGVMEDPPPARPLPPNYG